jgi:hypothetical protein
MLNGFFVGNEPGTVLTQAPIGTVFFGYPVATIRDLLGRSDVFGAAKGIRLHFDRPRSSNPSELYLAACGLSKDIADRDTNARADYFTSDNSPVAKADLPTFLHSKTTTNTCVFFSRDLMDSLIATPGAALIRFYVVPFGPQAGTEPNRSLAAVALDRNGDPVGNYHRSEEPCPPTCPMDYP